LNFGEQDLGQRLQSWGKKEWGTKATVAQMHEKRYHRRRGSRGQVRQQWWKDRKSGKVAWGAKSYYSAPWNKNKNDKQDKKDDKQDNQDDKQDKNDNDDKQDKNDKDDKQDKNDKDAVSATPDEPPMKKAKSVAGQEAIAAPTAPPASLAVPAAPHAAPFAALAGEALSGSTGSGATLGEVNAADFASAVAKAMVSMPPVMPGPVPIYDPFYVPGLVFLNPGPAPKAKAIAAPTVPGPTIEEVPEDGSDTEGSDMD